MGDFAREFFERIRALSGFTEQFPERVSEGMIKSFEMIVMESLRERFSEDRIQQARMRLEQEKAEGYERRG